MPGPKLQWVDFSDPNPMSVSTTRPSRYTALKPSGGFTSSMDSATTIDRFRFAHSRNISECQSRAPRFNAGDCAGSTAHVPVCPSSSDPSTVMEPDDPDGDSIFVVKGNRNAGRGERLVIVSTLPDA